MEQKKQVGEYWNKSAKGYSKSIKTELDNSEKQIWTKLILENAPEKEKLKILDIGCGPGFFSIIMSLAGHDVTGIDVTENMLKEAKENAKREGVSPVFIQSDVHDTGFPDDTFDLVISRNVTWTLYNPEKAFEEWKRILAPGGRLLYFDGNWYMHNFDEAMEKHFHDGIITYRELHGDFPLRCTMFQFEDYWLKLPMIGRKRPLWDKAQLWKMKLQDVVVDEDITDTVGRSDDDIGKYLYGNAPMFMVRATKVSKEEEDEWDVRLHFDGAAPLYGIAAVNAATKGLAFYDSFIKPELSENTKILDAGCGAGLLTALLAKDGFSVTAVDFCERMTEETEYTLKKAASSAEVITANLKNIEFADNSFDAVILKDVLWCTTNPEKVLDECIRVLAPGGRLIIADAERYKKLNEEERRAYMEKWYDISVNRLDFIYGVSDRRTSLIDNMSDRLPLSEVSRPAWDKDKLLERGLRLENGERVDEGETPESFVITFIK